MLLKNYFAAVSRTSIWGLPCSHCTYYTACWRTRHFQSFQNRVLVVRVNACNTLSLGCFQLTEEVKKNIFLELLGIKAGLRGVKHYRLGSLNAEFLLVLNFGRHFSGWREGEMIVVLGFWRVVVHMLLTLLKLSLFPIGVWTICQTIIK